MSNPEHPQLNLRLFAIASFVPIAIMFASMYLKPLWRDEYYSLFFTDRALPLSELLQGRLRVDVHPPFYMVVLYYWQMFAQSWFTQRCLSIAVLAATVFGVLKLTPANKTRFAYIFLLICAGSYWVIYFASEIRPYILLFCLSTLSVFLAWRILEAGVSRGRMLAWFFVGSAIGITHYFGALWFACLGLCLGVFLLRSGDRTGFLVVGIVTSLGLLTTAAWLAYSLPVMFLDGQVSTRSFSTQLGFTLNQYFRGLVVKTFGSNPLITCLGFGALIAAMKSGGKRRIDSVLIYAAIIMTIIPFFVHFTLVELIKERAFLPQMPAILFVLASGLAASKSKLLTYVPLVTAIMPFLFLTEYTKDREKIGDLQDYISQFSSQCQGAPVLAYYRDMWQTEFPLWATDKMVNSYNRKRSFSVSFLDAATARDVTPTTCPIKAVAMVMPKFEGKAEAIEAFERSGLNMSALTEKEYGKARYIIWVQE